MLALAGPAPRGMLAVVVGVSLGYEEMLALELVVGASIDLFNGWTQVACIL
jgi:hypothetical protein